MHTPDTETIITAILWSLVMATNEFVINREAIEDMISTNKEMGVMIASIVFSIIFIFWYSLQILLTNLLIMGKVLQGIKV